MNNHRTRYEFCQVSYWADYTASRSDEAWNRCLVSPLGMSSYGEQAFPNTPEGIAARDALISFLEKAFELGRSAAKREIREAIGVKDLRP